MSETVAFSLAVGCTTPYGDVLDADRHSGIVHGLVEQFSTVIFSYGIVQGCDPSLQLQERTIIVQGLTYSPLAILATIRNYARVEMGQHAIGWFTANPDDSYVLTSDEFTS